VKIELSRDNGQTVFVELPHEIFRSQQIEVGRQVFVVPKDGRIFAAEDYSI
jgi:hypothetical protein